MQQWTAWLSAHFNTRTLEEKLPLIAGGFENDIILKLYCFG